MIIPNGVTLMIYAGIAGVVGLYFGVNYLINKVENWVESK